jgi:Transglutaminase-like superfamily
MEHSLVWRCRRFVRRLRRLSSGAGRLLIQSAVLLPLTRLALFVIPFHKILNLSGGLSSTVSSRRQAETGAVQQVQWAVVRASRYIPGTRHCLTQALVVKSLLARRGQSAHVRIGVAKDTEGRLKAHAWVESNGSAIFGVPAAGLEEYQRLPHLDRA